MLTVRQNLLETIKGGNPDRLVNQYEFMHNIRDPVMGLVGNPGPGQGTKVNAWGVTYSWEPGWPGQIPVHIPTDLIVIQDMEDWKSYVKRPPVKVDEATWEPFVADAESVDRNDYFVGAMQIPGMFEQAHSQASMEELMCAFYEYPNEVKDLFKWIAEYEMLKADEVIKHVHPDLLFRHDDWGSKISTLMSPEVFEEFILPPTKEICDYWRSNGVELIVHHADCYCATLVPYMIEIGIDIWQGPTQTNDIPNLIEKYGGQISFMGGIESADLDRDDVTDEEIREHTEKIVRECGKKYFIPCLTQGGAFSTFPDVYGRTSAVIDQISADIFGEL